MPYSMHLLFGKHVVAKVLMLRESVVDILDLKSKYQHKLFCTPRIVM